MCISLHHHHHLLRGDPYLVVGLIVGYSWSKKIYCYFCIMFLQCINLLVYVVFGPPVYPRWVERVGYNRVRLLIRGYTNYTSFIDKNKIHPSSRKTNQNTYIWDTKVSLLQIILDIHPIANIRYVSRTKYAQDNKKLQKFCIHVRKSHSASKMSSKLC